MGNSISLSKKAADQESDEDVKQAMLERLRILNGMVNHVLDNAKINKLPTNWLPGQEIHTGTEVKYSKQVYVVLSKPLPNDDPDTAIKNFFGRNIEDHFKKIVTGSVGPVLRNTRMGEHEASHMFIQWSDNALFRLDAYYYRWNFSTNEIIIKGVKGVSGVVVMKREIDLAKTDISDISTALFLQGSHTYIDPEREEDAELVEAANDVLLQKIEDIQLAMHPRKKENDKEHEENDKEHEENDKEDDEDNDEDDDEED